MVQVVWSVTLGRLNDGMLGRTWFGEFGCFFRMGKESSYAARKGTYCMKKGSRSNKAARKLIECDD